MTQRTDDNTAGLVSLQEVLEVLDRLRWREHHATCASRLLLPCDCAFLARRVVLDELEGGVLELRRTLATRPEPTTYGEIR